MLFITITTSTLGTKQIFYHMSENLQTTGIQPI